MRFTLGAIAASIVAIGCGPEASNVVDRGVQTKTQALTTFNGTSYNGISFGGWSVRSVWSPIYSTSAFIRPVLSAPGPTGGIDPFSGLGPNGIGFYDADAVTVDDGRIAPDAVLEGLALFGALETGEQLELLVENVETRADGRLSFVINASDGRPLCGVDQDGKARRAIAVPGVWNTQSGVRGGGAWSDADGNFSFACAGSTIEKCISLGYGPEVRDIFGRPEKLLACVRMLRADYCGDGTSWTTNGRLVEVWDNDGINDQTMSDWPREAEWSSYGALCLDNPRLLFPDTSAAPLCLERLKYIKCSKYIVGSVHSSFLPTDEQKR